MHQGVSWDINLVNTSVFYLRTYLRISSLNRATQFVSPTTTRTLQVQLHYKMRHPTMNAAVAQLKRAVSKVEVERKFNPSPKFTSLFLFNERTGLRAQRCVTHHNQNGHSFTALRQPGELIRDTYYDTKHAKLGKLGLWVRQRRVSVVPLDPVESEDSQNCETNSQLSVTGNRLVVSHKHLFSFSRCNG